MSNWVYYEQLWARHESWIPCEVLSFPGLPDLSSSSSSLPDSDGFICCHAQHFWGPVVCKISLEPIVRIPPRLQNQLWFTAPFPQVCLRIDQSLPNKDTGHCRKEGRSIFGGDARIYLPRIISGCWDLVPRWTYFVHLSWKRGDLSSAEFFFDCNNWPYSQHEGDETSKRLYGYQTWGFCRWAGWLLTPLGIRSLHGCNKPASWIVIHFESLVQSLTERARQLKDNKIRCAVWICEYFYVCFSDTIQISWWVILRVTFSSISPYFLHHKTSASWLQDFASVMCPPFDGSLA